MTKQLGVIGYPLSHTLSPVFQQAALDYHAIPVTYSAWPTPPESLRETVKRLRGEDYMGFNITIPHKEQLLDLVDDVNEMARNVGAVNTVVNRDGVLTGHNTDTYGFVRSLKEKADFDPRGKSVLLLGAGGAARAAAYALAAEGVERLTIANRTVARGESLAEDVGSVLEEIEAVSLENVSGDADLIVNSTSVGMASGDSAGQTPIKAASIPRDALAYDMVYTPAETPFLRSAQEAGARVLGGLWMLIYQGAAAFELWTGKHAPVDVMYQAAQQAMEQ
ncbi:MAG: shikimate dehydrogenase [Chloroflexota bacterium]|nr:shikimate dehydrogenase [Chloroflexota bacterium]